MLPSDGGRILKRLGAILKDPHHGQSIQQDWRNGLSALPDWMRIIVRGLLQQASGKGTAKPAQRAGARAPQLAQESGQVVKRKKNR
jgi:hypothetical protein